MIWAGVLVLALFLAPFPAASAWADGNYRNRAALVDALDSAFVRFWDADSGSLGSGLASPVDFWMRFHVVKAVLAAMLIVALVRVGLRTWTGYTSAEGAARRAAAGALVVTTGFVGLTAILVLVANVQGAIAPLSSALGLLPMGTPDPALAQALAQARQDLTTGPSSPALAVLLHDFTVYHAAMAGLGALTAAGLMAAAVFFWRQRRRGAAGSGTGRHLLAVAALAAVGASGCFVVVTAANLSTTVRPAPALLGFFEGSG